MTINHTLRKVNGMLATIPVYQISGPKRYKIKYEAVTLASMITQTH